MQIIRALRREPSKSLNYRREKANHDDVITIVNVSISDR